MNALLKIVTSTACIVIIVLTGVFALRIQEKSISFDKTANVISAAPLLYEEKKDLDSMWVSTSTPSQVSMLYPERINRSYIQSSMWPPAIDSADEYSCEEQSDALVDRSRKKYNSKEYCVERNKESAVGTSYITYKVSSKEPFLNINFSIAFPNCNNYDEPQRSDCIQEQSSGVIDKMIVRMVGSIQ